MTRRKNKNKELLAFYAYQGNHEKKNVNSIDSIKKAITEFNSRKRRFVVKSWEDYNKSTFIDYEILQEIDKCFAFTCDLTFLNPNVLFELGYAIAKGKSIRVTVDESERGAKERYEKFILNKIRAQYYKNFNPILTCFEREDFQSNLFSVLINRENITENIDDLFFIQGKSERQAYIESIDLLNIHQEEHPKLSLLIDNSYEVEYQTLKFYYQSILQSKNIIIHLLSQDEENSADDNLKKSFFAGLASGLGKNILLIAPAIYKAPLDYEAITIQYQTPLECSSKLTDWIGKNILYLLPEETTEKTTKPIKEDDKDLSLIELGIGCMVAQNEKREDFLQYFIQTNSYLEAKKQPKTIFIGDKGTGKTAIFRKLEDEFKKDLINFVVSIKPESYDIIENIDLSAAFNNDATKEKFFITTWKVVIYANLLKQALTKLEFKKRNDNLEEYENVLFSFASKHENLLDLSFFGIVKHITEVELNKDFIEGPELLDVLYKKYLGAFISKLKEYFSHLKYIKIHILSDSLDIMWNQKKYKLEIQANLISSLINLNESIQTDLSMPKKEIEIINNIFLRSDMYKYIASNCINELDKFNTITKLIDWTEYPKKLKELIEERFRHILNIGIEKSPSEVWSDYFEDYHGISAFDKICENIILRPRDMLFFVSKLIESAYNNNRDKISLDDFKYAKKHYNKFLKTVWIDELKYEFNNIYEIFEEFDSYSMRHITLGVIKKIIRKYNYRPNKIHLLLKRLFNYNYLIAIDEQNSNIDDYTVLENYGFIRRLLCDFKLKILTDSFYRYR